MSAASAPVTVGSMWLGTNSTHKGWRVRVNFVSVNHVGFIVVHGPGHRRGLKCKLPPEKFRREHIPLRGGR